MDSILETTLVRIFAKEREKAMQRGDYGAAILAAVFEDAVVNSS